MFTVYHLIGKQNTNCLREEKKSFNVLISLWWRDGKDHNRSAIWIGLWNDMCHCSEHSWSSCIL